MYNKYRWKKSNKCVEVQFNNSKGGILFPAFPKLIQLQGGISKNLILFFLYGGRNQWVSSKIYLEMKFYKGKTQSWKLKIIQHIIPRQKL